MYAIVEIGAKQYKVTKDMTIDIDKVEAAEGASLSIDKVLMFVDEKNVLVGKPYLNNVKVNAKVVKEVRGKKVLGVKFKKRKSYTRTYGARQDFLRLKIEELALA